MANTSTPDSQRNEQRTLRPDTRLLPRRSTIAILRQFARIYTPMGQSPIGVFMAN